jgi:dolichol-phosphate mannosyltransferase
VGSTAPRRRSATPSLDLIVPVYNEEEVLPHLLARLEEVFGAEARAAAGLGEVRYLFIDDGSSDRTAEILQERIARGLPAALLRFTRNFGHQSAVSAGLDHARADLVAVIDADLQDPPELIPEMVATWRQGYDVVYAQRRARPEGPLKRLGYWGFYRLVRLLSEVKVPLDSGDFCLMDARVVRALCSLPERLRFPRGLRAWVGFRQTGIAYDRPPREAGSAKYNLRRLYHLATDGIASLSLRPLRLAQAFSFAFSALSLLLLGGMVVRLLVGTVGESLLYFLLLAILFCIGNAIITFCLYILGAYIGRSYLEAKQRPPYLVLETVGLDGAAADAEDGADA